MPLVRFFLFIFLISVVGAFLTTWLYPIIKKMFLKYEKNIEKRSDAVDKEMKEKKKKW